jgi:hypothetical protein
MTAVPDPSYVIRTEKCEIIHGATAVVLRGSSEHSCRLTRIVLLRVRNDNFTSEYT